MLDPGGGAGAAGRRPQARPRGVGADSEGRRVLYPQVIVLSALGGGGGTRKSGTRVWARRDALRRGTAQLSPGIPRARVAHTSAPCLSARPERAEELLLVRPTALPIRLVSRLAPPGPTHTAGGTRTHSDRSGVQLKDKWRNLIKFRHIDPAEQETFKPKQQGPWSKTYRRGGRCALARTRLHARSGGGGGDGSCPSACPRPCQAGCMTGWGA